MQTEVKTESFYSKTTTETQKIILASLSLLATFAWNGAIHGWFSEQEYLKTHGPWVYAIFMTILVVGVTHLLTKFKKKTKKTITSVDPKTGQKEETVIVLEGEEDENVKDNTLEKAVIAEKEIEEQKQ